MSLGKNKRFTVRVKLTGSSRIITPKVIDAYMAAGGDLYEALPYALLRARVEFLYDAMRMYIPGPMCPR
jgi:hypothetical protein